MMQRRTRFGAITGMRPVTSIPGGIPSALLNRREMLRRSCAGFGMVGLAGLLGGRAAWAATAPANGAGVSPPKPAAGASRPPHFAARAKHVIFLFLNGGPSHVDTFDPKPALARYEGQQPAGDLYKKSKGSGYMPSPLTFRKCGRSGIEVSETLPRLARVIDDCCVI